MPPVVHIGLVLITWLSLSVQPTLAQSGPRMRLSAEQIPISAGQTASVDVLIEEVTNLGSFQFNLLYDPDLIELQAVQLGEFLGQTGRQPTPLGPRTDRPGDTAFGAFTLGSPDQRGPDGNGRLATVHLVGKKAGTVSLRLDRPQATDPVGQPLALALPSSAHAGGTGVALQTTPPALTPTLGSDGQAAQSQAERGSAALGPPIPTPRPATAVGLPWPALAGLVIVAIGVVVVIARRRR